MASPTYVALDLELVEANTSASRVIEIGAVRFDEAGIREEWSTLVNPGVAMPHGIKLLTGLADADLASAPSLEQVAPRLSAFLADDPLVGQSIDIDVAHLARQGFRLPNRQLDTFAFATLLLPGLPSYDLLAIARALGLTIPPPHRALSDAHLARQVFLTLVGRIRSLDLDVLMHVNRLTRGLSWPFADLFVAAEAEQRRRLVEDALGGVAVGGLALGLSRVLAPPEGRPDAMVPNTQTRSLDVAGLEHALQPGGALAAALPSYEQRPEQLAMLRAVADAFNRGRHLIVEAGTGTGKSLAYLLPGLAFAVANNRRVVVSTNTINLQDQLYEKDVPDVVHAMDYRARTTVLKGRSNYLCLRRWLTLLRAEDFTLDEASLLVKTLLWIGQTATGDRSELRFTVEEEAVWSRVCSQAESCSPLTCPYHREGSCFIARARRRAEGSHVVIVNHALLLSDIATGSRVIPESAHLIIDEAHHLEAQATTQLGYEVSLRSFAAPLNALASRDTPTGVAGVVARLRAGGLPERRVQQLEAEAARIQGQAASALERAAATFEALAELMDVRAVPGEMAPALRLTTMVRRDSEWMPVEQRWAEARSDLEAIRHALEPILEELGDAAAATGDALTVGDLEGDDFTTEPSRRGEVLSERSNDPLQAGLAVLSAAATSFADLLAELGGTAHQLDALIDQTHGIIAEPPRDAVCWATGGPQSLIPNPQSPTLHRAPLEVASYIQRWLLDAKATVVFTSATLASDGTFDYIRERLGAQGAAELAVGSPFNYERAALLFLPADIPEPAQPGYARRAADAIADVAEALGGRTLALFTSYAQLRATRDMIRDRMDRAQIVLMGQGIDGPRTRLLQQFKTTDRALLLGTASFWEGVDVVGEALSALVIARLPFAVPTDPVFAARSEQFDNPFAQYAVPQAILRFKQGFGRLIRSQTDHGVVIVLDRRIISKSYGAAFLGSLPACTLSRAPIATVGAVARAWVDERGPHPSA